MNNLTIINKLQSINECLKNEHGINGINALNDLINALKEEETLKGFKGGDKERIKLALTLQKQGLNGTRPILGLFHYTSDNRQVFIDKSCAWLVSLKEEDFIKEVKTTDDTVEISTRRSFFRYDSSQKNTFPETKNIFIKSGYTEVNIDTQKLMTFLKINKKEEQVIVSLNGVEMTVNPTYFYNMLIISNNYKKDTITIRYVSPNKPMQVEDNGLICNILHSIKESPRIDF